MDDTFIRAPQAKVSSLTELLFDGADSVPYSLTPFGGGVRRCIGMSLAQLEIEVVVERILALAVPEPAGPLEASRLVSVTIIPAKGGRVRIRRRKAHSSV
jgi:cytochrome P450